MKKQWLIALILALAVPTFAKADHDNDQDKDDKIEMMKTELGLSDDQVKKIEASREKYKAQLQEKETVADAANEKFIAAMKNANSSSGELQSLFNQKMEAYKTLQEMRFQSRMEFRDVLTADQRAKFMKKREAMHDKRDDRREKKAGKTRQAPASKN